MRSFKLKTKLSVGAVSIVFLVMILSTVIVSLIIYQQNRNTSFNMLEQTINIIRNDILTIENKLLATSRQIAVTNELGGKIKFLHDQNQTGESFNDMFSRNTLREVTTTLYNISLSANIQKAMVYDTKGALIAFVTISDEGAVLGFPFDKGFETAVLKAGDQLNIDTWKPTDKVELIETTYSKSIKEKETAQVEVIAGRTSVVAYAPVMVNQYDEEKDALVLAQIGFVTAIFQFDADFTERLSRLTGTDINVFNQMSLDVGKLPGYVELKEENIPETISNWDINEQKTVLSGITLKQGDFFQGVLPLYSEDKYVGSIAALYSTKNAMANTWDIIIILCLVSLGCVILVIPLSMLYSRTLTKPLENLSSVLIAVEQSGEFSERVEVASNDEVGITANAFNKMMARLQSSISSINQVMGSMKEGDLSSLVTGDYSGELKTLQESSNESIKILSETLDRVNQASMEVHLSSEELSSAAQKLADGTSQQAASLEEVSASMNEIQAQAKTNNENASEAQTLSNQTINTVKQGNDQMEDLLNSMKRINETSDQVNKIIKIIDEIAFQTNLLALNAAVEAARAGKYGKGFAVVAEEVRNLAARSSEAAKNTADLISSSVREVEQGVVNADKTAELLKEITSCTDRSAVLLKEISQSSQSQNEGIKEVNAGLNQVNNIVQQNSAIAEESASAARDLSSYSNDLKIMMNRFKLSEETSSHYDSNIRQVEYQEDASMMDDEESEDSWNPAHTGLLTDK